MKTRNALSVLKLMSFFLLILITSCKQEFLEGKKVSAMDVKVYLPLAEKPHATVEAFSSLKYVIDPVAKTTSFSIPVYRGGEYDFDPLTVDVSVDNTAIAGLTASGALPSNTQVIASSDFVTLTKDTLKLDNFIMKGNIIVTVKNDEINKYAGKTVALGVKIANSSKQSVNPALDKLVIYFNADVFIDAVAPRDNLVDKTKWGIIKYSDGVTFTINNDGSMFAQGGNGGHQGVVQTFDLQANKQYKIDMNVEGSGATDCWFEVYVGKAAPVPGKDYSDGGARISLNTWAGCGKGPFNALLSTLSCSGSGNVITFPTAGTVYLVIRSGGASLGAKGIKITNIDFRRVN